MAEDTVAGNSYTVDVDELKIIDVDSHFTEPGDLWLSRAPASLRDRVPQVKDIDGRPNWVIDGKVIGYANSFSVVGMNGHKVKSTEMFDIPIQDAYPPASNPKARVEMLDRLGIYAQLMYPNMAGFGGQLFGELTDSELKRTCVSIYNDAAAEIQEESGQRLFPMAMVPWWDIEGSVTELKRAAANGAHGIVMCSDPQRRGAPDLAEPEWTPFWETCCELDLPVNFHIAASGEIQNFISSEPWPSQVQAAKQVMSGMFLFLGNSKVILNMVFGGVLERFPELRIVSVESGTSWLPFLMQAANYGHGEIVAGGGRLLPEHPADYIRRQIYTCFWFESLTPDAFRYLDEDHVMFETDFPHSTCLYPDPVEYIKSSLVSIRPELQRKLLQDNAANLYNIPVPVAV